LGDIDAMLIESAALNVESGPAIHLNQVARLNLADWLRSIVHVHAILEDV
jgi:hypothetical protein